MTATAPRTLPNPPTVRPNYDGTIAASGITFTIPHPAARGMGATITPSGDRWMVDAFGWPGYGVPVYLMSFALAMHTAERLIARLWDIVQPEY